jgi:hypothetical protein
VEGEVLDDEQLIFSFPHPARHAVVLQPNTGVNVPRVRGEVRRQPKACRERNLLDGPSERPRPPMLMGRASVIVIAATPPATVLPDARVGKRHLLALTVAGIDDVAGINTAPEPAPHWGHCAALSCAKPSANGYRGMPLDLWRPLWAPRPAAGHHEARLTRLARWDSSSCWPPGVFYPRSYWRDGTPPLRAARGARP